MPDKSKTSAWLIKLILLLMAVIGFFGKRTLDAMDARQELTEIKVDEINHKVDLLTGRLGDSDHKVAAR